MKLKIILMGFLCLFGLKDAMAQREVLSLEEAIEAAKQNAKAIVLADMDRQIAEAQFKETQAIFLPQVRLSYSALSTDNPLNVFGFKMQQQRVQQSDFQPDLLNNPGSTQDYSAQAMVKQPLVNWDLIKNRQAARAQIRIKELQKERQEDYMVMQVENEFYQLQFSYQAVETLRQSLETARALYKFTEDHYNQGFVQKSDLLNVGVYVKSIQSELEMAESEVENISDNLSVLMNREIGAIYQVAALQEKQELGEVSLSENRADFEAIALASATYDNLIHATRGSAFPKLNGFASYQFNDPELTDFHSGSYLVGLELSWDIFKGNSVRTKVRTQKIEKEKLDQELLKMKQENKKELDKTKRLLQNIQTQLITTFSAIEQAQESLHIIQNRYAQNLVGITDVLSAQQQLAHQQLAYQQTVLQQNMTLSYLEFLTKK